MRFSRVSKDCFKSSRVHCNRVFGERINRMMNHQSANKRQLIIVWICAVQLEDKQTCWPSFHKSNSKHRKDLYLKSLGKVMNF